MATERLQTRAAGLWRLEQAQHGVVSRAQLEGLGFGPAAIRHRLARGRLHRLMPGVYAVGRPGVTDRGWWMAAVLACGPRAQLSHRSAAALLGIHRRWTGPPEVVVPADVVRCRPGVRVHRRAVPKLDGHPGPARADREAIVPTERDRIPVTDPAVVLVDLATCLPTWQLEAAINEADHHGLIDPERLRSAIVWLPRRPGARRLRLLLDSSTESLTSTILEHRFLPLAQKAGLPRPRTQKRLGGGRVDFLWPQLGLIVETDSLRYHRTAFKQAADRRRDNTHARSGLITLRFTHGQVRHEPDYVVAELRTVARRLTTRPRGELEGKLLP